MNILVAGVGNIFLGDDAFGVEVVQALARHALPPNVRICDFGIRGVDLGLELASAPYAAIIVDTAQRGGPPGTLYLIETDGAADRAAVCAARTFSPHAMDPDSVFEWARHVGTGCSRVLLLCCEPESFGTDTPEQGRLGLSAPVTAAVPRAVEKIKDLVSDWLNSEGVFS